MSKEILPNRSNWHNSERVDDEGEGGVATFDKVKEEILEWRAVSPITKSK